MKSSVRGGRTLRRLLKRLKIKNKTSSNATRGKKNSPPIQIEALSLIQY